MPFAFIADDLTKPPLRRFEREQGKRRVRPGAGLNELLEPGEVFRPPHHRQAPARVADELSKKLDRDRLGVMKPVGKGRDG